MKDEIPVLEFNDVTLESRGAMVPCRLKLSDQGVAFRNEKTGKLEQLSGSECDVISWQRLAAGYGIRIFTTNGHLYRFGGFKESDQSKLEKFFKNTFNKTMAEKEFSVKGWNYGAVTFYGSVLSFDVNKLPAFEIPLNHVSGCPVGKNEVTIEFHQHDDAPVNLMEMRFHIPSSELAGDDPVVNFQEKILSRASVITATGDALATFNEVQCLTPRGRYEIKIYPAFIQLHGKTFDFKIPTDTVVRLFLLPHMDGRQHFFVVSIDPPIKQGQTRYPHLIFQFYEETVAEVELPLSEDEVQSRFEGRLEKNLSGPEFEVLSRLLKGICNRKIVTPGSFTGKTGTPAVSCSFKAAAGFLYPLERGFLYIHKPPVFIRLDEVSAVNFARSGSTTRSFDFELECKNGTINTFSSIDKGEYNRLFDYVTQKKMRIRNHSKMDVVNVSDAFSDSDAEDQDHYLNRVRAEAKERENEEESESEDSDFNPGEEGSDVAEEFDSNPSTTDSGSESEGSGPEKKKKDHKEKEHKPKKAKTVSEKPRKRKPKKERDANKPKRPQSAYFLWLNENREKIKAENPGISITDLTKKAGVLWKEVGDKSKWEEMASKAKKEYEAAMKEYKAGGGSAPENKPTKKASSSPSKAGSGSGFKSKEFIEETDSSSEESLSDDDKPLKKKPKAEVKKEVKEEQESKGESSGDSGSE